MTIRKLRNLIGRKIKYLRKSHNLSQEQFAEFIDMSREHISCIERGKNTISIDSLYKIAKYFNLDIKDFFE